MARMKELEDENPRMKKMHAEERLKAEIVAEALTKMVAPSQRRETAQWVVAQRSAIVRLPCQAFAIAQTLLWLSRQARRGKRCGSRLAFSPD